MCQHCRASLIACKTSRNCDVITMSNEQSKTDQYQIRLSHAFRAQLEEQARIDGDKTLATWLKRVLRKELLSRGIEPKG